ncbi:photosystem II protein Psb27 [Cyanobium sp. ATX 6F1]|uniref:photosystem II protein Psb27 n=1 Tax=unclassified Cyanobium TaxID=2627006 RepID=UPI0020CC3BD0|nr:photosystem II protein Psb27 [Cyanobium sp. ATX 6F1]MCP9915448.1 photosystem II protein Psb27 [Cyanobium sp. ATX 6F1]
MAAVLVRVKASLVAVCLCLVLVLSACTSASGPITGNYVDDTVAVAQSLLTTIALPQDDPSRKQAEVEARSLINSYTARYRPQARLNGLSSFTTMQTAMNALAAHYAAYANRPIPEALKARLDKELKKAETSVVRGA